MSSRPLCVEPLDERALPAARLSAPVAEVAQTAAPDQTPAVLQGSAELTLPADAAVKLVLRGGDADRPTAFAVVVGGGAGAVVKFVNGEVRTVGLDAPAGGPRATLTLRTDDTGTRAFLRRADTGEYLTPAGSWSTDHTAAAETTDAPPAPVVVATPPPAAPTPAAPVTPPASVPPADATPPQTPSTAPADPAGLPTVPRSFSHIRLANLAYYGTPFDKPTTGLLTDGVDLVVPNLDYLDDVAALNPDAAQFVYTNVSNIYLGLLTDWNSYADRRGLNREQAFYHVTKATPLTGNSASAVAVSRFWGVFRSTPGGWDNLTRDAAHTGNDLAFADQGQAVAVGYLEKFREINLDLKSGAAGGWGYSLEYVSKVDGAGKPTEWKTLKTLGDTTNGLTRDGRITFDPPADWRPASVGDSAGLYYVRFRTTKAGTAPLAVTVLGRDYTAGGVIPAFDAAADKNGDGYLSDAEYAKRAKGMDARFRYESRLTYPQYGPMRFATNVADPGFRAWAGDYHGRFLKDYPLARGFFVDNSAGRLAVDPAGVAESLEGYADAYGSLLGAMDAAFRKSGKWLLANTSGGAGTAEPIAANGVSSLEEFALRPLAASHVQYDDLTARLAARHALLAGRGYEILDSLPTGGVDATDPRLQLATLAMYYTLADPATSMLMVNGGNEPASSWERHYIPASAVDVGQPTEATGVWATGADPSNKSLTYKVYGRAYSRGLVLYKPLSYALGAGTGTTADGTATTHDLGGLYRPVRADGSLGAATRTVTLRNGEGAVLVKA